MPCLDLIRAVVNCVCVAGVETVKIQLLVSRIIIYTVYKLLKKIGIGGNGFIFLFFLFFTC